MDSFKNHPLSVIAYLLISLVLIVYILIVGREIMAPLVFAVLFTLMLAPICSWVERFVKSRVASIFIVFLGVLLLLALVLSLFSYQLIEVFQNMPAISGKIKEGIEEFIIWISNITGYSVAEGRQWVQDNLSNVLNMPINIIGDSLSASSTVAVQFGVMIIYIFFMLWYRSAIRSFLLMQFAKKDRDEGEELIMRIQNIIGHYLYGLLTVILILGVLNSLGLWLIGINYAIFWGFLAATLIIIPYIGTTLGGLLPFIYSIATMEDWWQPVAVVAYYAAIQQIEGNFITPKVVGSSVKINPLVAILSLIIGASIWGIAGMILALPVVAVIKIVFDEIDMMKPVALMLSNNLLKDQDKFLGEWDDARYRITKLFRF